LVDRESPDKNTQKMQVTQKYFSFAEVVQGRDESVRVTDDGLLSAVDLARVVTGRLSIFIKMVFYNT